MHLAYNSTYMNTKNIIIAVVVLVLIAIAGFFLTKLPATNTAINTPTNDEVTPSPDTSENEPAPDSEEPVDEARGDETVIGTSVDGNPITAYHIGTGETELLFIGGIHGGYSWNTALLAYELIDYLDANPKAVPEDITVTIIPVANPDGLKETVGTFGRFSPTVALAKTDAARIAGRFNANNVDLNRNFDCDWQASGTWQNRTVSGGAKAFSEPEADAIKKYIDAHTPAAAVVWFSAEGKVYPSACGGAPSSDSVALANTFAKAAGYPTGTEFDAYTITGDMVNWLAKEGIPAISVLLTDHQSTEWSKNQAGFEAVVAAYAN